MTSDLERAYDSLAAWCRERSFAGYDPFDGLNSRVFQATPLRHSRTARLLWTQLLKRSPVNLRGLACVRVGKNGKGTALFALAALARFRRQRTKDAANEARALLNDLLSARLNGWSGAAWGYNFDWQGRAFFAPLGTPTVVPTAFAARALVEAALAFDDGTYLEVARSACDFILRDLRRTEESETEVCWSYSPLDWTRVFNASLLAAETLGAVGALAGQLPLCHLAVRGARFVVHRQRPDGSWLYGADRSQSWIDNFHTAFVLTSLTRITAFHSDCRAEFSDAIKRGCEFWSENFFLENGWAKYFQDRRHPADTHSSAAAIVALLEMQSMNREALPLAEKIAGWALRHLRDERGFFYYQRNLLYTARTPYMRWSQAWMLYALGRLLEARAADALQD